MEEQIYRIEPAAAWADSITDEEVITYIKDSEFAEKQISEGRDFCYFLNKTYYTDDQQNAEYLCMAYTLNESANLERASIIDMILEEGETYLLHRIKVFREGKLIDKIKDTQIKIFENEDQSSGGVLNKSKKINLSIKDLRLHDVLVMEDARVKTFSERDFLRKDFSKYVWVSPDVYWAYGKYHFTFINQREKNVSCKSVFFRDEAGAIIEPEMKTLKKGERFEFVQQNYINNVDINREIHPFVDFATEATWEELSDYFAPLYQEVFKKSNLRDFAPELVDKLQNFSTEEEQLQYAIEYVQNNIYYMYNADEMNGHKPQEPDITFNNKQGDCKAKTTLLKTILDYLDIESEVVLVHYQNDFYLKYYLPSLLAFNHVILKINYKGKEYFVDPTSKDEFGRIENRSLIHFKHYLQALPDQHLMFRMPYRFENFCIDENIKITTEGNKGTIVIDTTYRYNRANNMRRYFKTTTRREVIDSWNNFLFYALNYSSDRNEEDIRRIFEDAQVEIINDDKTENAFSIRYSSTVQNPYYTDKKGNRFLMFFDHNVLKNAIRDFTHKDVTFWVSFDSECYQIHLETDQKIDTQERFTIQECDIKHKYFKYQTRKKINKKGGSVFIEYRPTTNFEIPKEEFEDYRKAYFEVADSNFGLGLDILEPGLLNNLKHLFKRS